MREKLASGEEELINSSMTRKKLAHLRKQLVPLVTAYPLRDQILSSVYQPPPSV